MLQRVRIEEAQELLTAAVKPIEETEQVFLMESIGRVLAREVLAERDQPPFPRSPLDGYAVRSADLQGASKDHPARLQVVGKIYAGYVFEGTVEAGQAVRLMTGAPIPPGADTVIKQEDTDLREVMVEIYVTSKPYKNYCYQGEDFKAGTVLLDSRRTIDAGKITVLSSLGLDKVPVYRRPKVCVFSTGDEVIAPGQPWIPGKIYDSNRAYIHSRLLEFGNPPMISRHVQDEAEVVAQEIREAAKEADFILTTGGVSVGEKDIMHEVVKLLGATPLFWKVQIKPGSPTLAFVYQDTLVLALSGNPFGAIANFELLARPVLAQLSRNEAWDLNVQKAVLQNDYKKGPGTRRFLRGYLEDGKVFINGRNQASGAISAMAECNCMVEIPADQAGASAGDKVFIYRIS